MSRGSFIEKPGDFAQTRHFASIRTPAGPLFAYAETSRPWSIRTVTCCRVTIASDGCQPAGAEAPSERRCQSREPFRREALPRGATRSDVQNPMNTCCRNRASARHRKLSVHTRGFTLVELLITLAVVAIMLGIGVPSFQETIVRNRLMTQTNDILTAVNLARSEAVKRNRTVTLCRADDASATACAGTGTWEHWIILAGADNVVRRGSPPRFGNSMSVTSSLPGGELRLSPDGLARTSAGSLANAQTITVCATNGPAENRRQVVLGAGSRLSVTKSSGACS